MKYFLYNPITGNIVHYGESPEELTESFIPDLGLIDAGGYTQLDMTNLTVVDGQLLHNGVQEILANSYQIKNTWQTLEQSPLTILGVTVDCDSLSELRMKNTIDNWDALPNIEGQMETIGGIRKIYWSMVTGKVALTLGELQAVYLTMVEQRAVRAAVLFSNYQRIKSLPSVALSYIQDETNWFM